MSMTHHLRPVYLVDGLRTPFLKLEKGLGEFLASDLAVACGKPLLLRQKFKPQALDSVILGSTISKPEEANIARLVSLRLGCGDDVPAWTVQRNCGSGLQAVDDARLAIASGRANLILAGGTEAMSQAPFLLNDSMADFLLNWMGARSWSLRFSLLKRLRPQFLAPTYSLLRGLCDPIVELSMGQTAEILASRFQISRKEMDAFALSSHQRLGEAIDKHQMQQITPLFSPKGHLITHDQGLRRETTLEKLGQLKSVFDKKVGLVTAGNSSQISDGACLLILASEEAVKKYGLSVKAILKNCEWAGLSPREMGLGPVKAMRGLLIKEKLSLKEIDYFEINEAFAAQVLSCAKGMGDKTLFPNEALESNQIGEIPLDRLNIRGGAVALGHPIAATGARIVLEIADILEQTKARRGIASLCIGGGQGGAMLVERQG